MKKATPGKVMKTAKKVAAKVKAAGGIQGLVGGRPGDRYGKGKPKSI